MLFHLFGYCTFLSSNQTPKLAIVNQIYLVLLVLWHPVKIPFESQLQQLLFFSDLYSKKHPNPFLIPLAIMMSNSQLVVFCLMRWLNPHGKWLEDELVFKISNNLARIPQSN